MGNRTPQEIARREIRVVLTAVIIIVVWAVLR